MDLGRRRPQRSWSHQSISSLGRTHDEEVQRKRLMTEEYKRALVAQLEEQRQMREQEKMQVEEERRLQRKLLKEATAKRQEASSLHVAQVRPRKSEESQNTATTSQNYRRVPVSKPEHGHAPSLGSSQAEMLRNKHLRAEEYKHHLVAQIEEQRRRREQEKVTRLEEEKKAIWEQQFKQESPQARGQEVLSTKRREEPHTSCAAPQKHRYVHHALWDPVEVETALKKHQKEEEYKRVLQAQIEEQRQRREKEKEAQRAEDQVVEQMEERRLKREKEVKQWRFPQDTLGRRHEVTVDTHATMEFSRSSKYAHNLSCLLDPAQLDLIQRKRIRDEEHKRELDIQVAAQKQRRVKEKEEQLAKELAEEKAEERRMRRDEEFRQQKLLLEQKKRELEEQMEEQRQWREKEVRLAKQQEHKQAKFQLDARKKGLHPNWREEQLDRMQCDTSPQRFTLITRSNQDVSRQMHSTEYVSLKVCDSWDRLGYTVVTVHTKDAAIQTEPHDGFLPSSEMLVRTTPRHAEDRSRQPSPPVPAVQRWLQHKSTHPDPSPSEGGAEVDQECPSSCSGPSAQCVPWGSLPGGPVCKTPSTPPAEDSLQDCNPTKHSTQESAPSGPARKAERIGD